MSERCQPVGSDVFLTAIRQQLDLDTTGARLLSAHVNAVFHLPARDLVVRLAPPETAERVATSLAVTRYLAADGFPTVEPADIDDQPITIGGRVASFWKYVPGMAQPRPNTTELGHLLHDLHARPIPPIRLHPLTDPMAHLALALSMFPDAVTDDDRRWLLDRHAQLLRAWHDLTAHSQPSLIHGDAHLNNLIRHRDGRALLGDWDNVSIGPREWDLIQPYYTHRRFGLPSQELDSFTAAVETDLRISAPDSVDVLIAIRELSGLAAYIRNTSTSHPASAETHWRLQTLRSGDSAARWTSPHDTRQNCYADQKAASADTGMPK